MAKKHLLWIVPLAVLVFALFPQSSPLVDEMGYEHPFPGLWVARGEYDEPAFENTEVFLVSRDVYYQGQLVAAHYLSRCYEPAVTDPARGRACVTNLITELGWRPQYGNETVVFFLVGWKDEIVPTDIEWVFSPAYGDNPEDGLVGIHFLSFRFVDGISESWKWYEMTRLFLVGEVVGDSFGCNGLYFTRGLDDDYLRLGTGCPVYPGEGLG